MRCIMGYYSLLLWWRAEVTNVIFAYSYLKLQPVGKTLSNMQTSAHKPFSLPPPRPWGVGSVLMHLQLASSGISPSSNLQWFITSQLHPQRVWLTIGTTLTCLFSEVRSVKSKLICSVDVGTHCFWLGCELTHVPWQRCSFIWCGLKPFCSTGIIVGLNLQGCSSSFNDDTHAEKRISPS